MPNNVITLDIDSASFGRTRRTKRLGLIVPAMNTACEMEWAEILREVEERVSLHVSRIDAYDTPEIIDGTLPKHLARAIEELTDAGVDLIAYAGVASGLPLSRLADAMQRQAGVLCVVASSAIAAACDALKMVRVAIAAPYGERLMHQENEFFSTVGLDVQKMTGLGIGEPGKGGKGTFDYADMARLTDQAIVNLATQAMADCDAELLIISGSNLPSTHLIPKLERDLNVPVISSNTALLWQSLRQMGMHESLQGYGFLLDRG